MQPRASISSAAFIQSRHNPHLKDLRRRLHSGHAEDGLIAIEGDHLMQEAIHSGMKIHALFLREGRTQDSLKPFDDSAQKFIVAGDAFDSASATESPQGVIALVDVPSWNLEELLKGKSPILLVLAGLQDPGNLGTIIRSAEAFGATGILTTPGTVSQWNQKALRASAGSSFRLPVVAMESEEDLAQLEVRDISLYAAAARSGKAVSHERLDKPVAFAIGNEGAGVPESVSRFCAGTIHIPCPGNVESLNAAVAASIVLYEAARQRGKAKDGKGA